MKTMKKLLVAALLFALLAQALALPAYAESPPPPPEADTTEAAPAAEAEPAAEEPAAEDPGAEAPPEAAAPAGEEDGAEPQGTTVTWNSNTPTPPTVTNGDTVDISGEIGGSLVVPANATVSVTGTAAIASGSFVAVRLNENATLNWGAKLTGQLTLTAAIGASGPFVANITSGAVITNNNTGVSDFGLSVSSATSMRLDVNVYGTIRSASRATVKVSGGTVTVHDGALVECTYASSGYAFLMESKSLLHIAGGTVRTAGQAITINDASASAVITGGNFSEANSLAGVDYGTFALLGGTLGSNSKASLQYGATGYYIGDYANRFNVFGTSTVAALDVPNLVQVGRADEPYIYNAERALIGGGIWADLHQGLDLHSATITPTAGSVIENNCILLEGLIHDPAVTVTVAGATVAGVTVPTFTTQPFGVNLAPPGNYSATLSPNSHNFPLMISGYTTPAAETFTIENTGNQTLTGLTATLESGISFETDWADDHPAPFSLAPGEKTTFTVSPKADLVADAYTDTLTVSGLTIDPKEAALFFTVLAPDEACTITYDANGGSGSMPASIAKIGQGFSPADCAFTPPQDMQFYGWAVGSVDGPEIEIGMPYIFNEDTTLYAIWMKDTTEISWLYATPSRLRAEGGSATIELVGKDLRSGLTVAAFDGNNQILTAQTDYRNRAVLAGFPANTTEQDKAYTIRASRDGGASWCAAECAVVVRAANALPGPISAHKSMVRLMGDGTVYFGITVEDEAYEDDVELVIIEPQVVDGEETRGTPKATSAYLTPAMDVESFHFGVNMVYLTRPADGPSGTVYVRVRYASFPDIYAECRVEVDGTDYTGVEDYAPVHLASTKMTFYTYLDVDKNLLPLWHETPKREGDERTRPLALDGADICFAEGSTPGANDLLAFSPQDENRLLVEYAPNVEISMIKNGKTYSGKLLITPKGGKPFTTKEKVSITLNTALPKLKAAPAVKFNSFYQAEAASFKTGPAWQGLNRDIVSMIRFTSAGGIESTVYELELPTEATEITSAARASSNADALAGWVDYNPDTGVLSLKKTDVNMPVKTLYFEVRPNEWCSRDFDPYRLPVAVKVSSARTSPAVKLKAASGKIYAEKDKTDPLTLQLLNKNSKLAYGALGVESLVLAEPDSVPFTLDFDNIGGLARLTPTQDLTATRYTLNLTAGFEGTTHTVPLRYTVSVVKKGTAVKPKPSQSTVTLNPSLDSGDMAIFEVLPSIAGYKLDYGDITPTVLKSNGRPLDGPAPFTIQGNRVGIDGKVVLDVPKDTPNATYKLRLTHTNGQKADVKVVLANRPVTATAKVKGSVNLTTGQGATLTVSFKNYKGTYADTPSVTFYNNAKCRPQDEVNSLEETGWDGDSFTVNSPTSLAKGTYYAIVSGNTPGGPVTTPKAKITVVSPKPKLNQSLKKATMYRGDVNDEVVVKLSVPAGTSAIKTVAIQPLKGKTEADNGTGFKLVDIGGGYYAIRFAKGAPTATLPKKTTVLTLKVTLAGNAVSTASAKVTITVK